MQADSLLVLRPFAEPWERQIEKVEVGIKLINRFEGQRQTPNPDAMTKLVLAEITTLNRAPPAMQPSTSTVCSELQETAHLQTYAP
jgi:hypothetical protein